MQLTRMLRLSSLTTGAAAVLALGVAPRAAHGFAEDLCYAQGGGPLSNCGPLPPVCLPAGTETTMCKAAILAVVARNRRASDSGRSSVHSDSTYLLAQAVGFSPTDAYWIAAYDEATDLNAFEPRDNHSMPVGGGSLATANISGFTRTNVQAAGFLLHLIAPYNHGSAAPPPGIDGLHPVPTDAQAEPTLASFRAWALAPSSAATPACIAGLTTQSPAGDYATGPACYATGTALQGKVAVFAIASVSFSNATGPQIAQSTTPAIYASAFDNLVAGDGAHDARANHAADARLGVYLHLLADRITHHVCTDRTAIAGPSDAGFQIDLGGAECAQPIHLLRHAWETGVRFAELRPQDRTTEAALTAVYGELVAFARARGVLRPGADTPAIRAAYTTALGRALQEFDAAARVAAIDAIGCAHQLAPFPGQPACGAPATH